MKKKNLKKQREDLPKPPSQRGAEGFESYYQGLYKDQWEKIRLSLKNEVHKIKLVSPFSDFTPESLYELDEASVWTARALDLKPGERFLDMCAAPGGKSLTIISSVLGEGEFYLNDMSHDRVHRLKRVLREHLPESLQDRYFVTCRDASRWGQHEPEAFDAILLDAPCSGERHLLDHPRELQNWSPQRGKGLAQRQYSLLCSAAQSLKRGGRLIYSTCTLNTLENDGVISRFSERKPGILSVDPNLKSHLLQMTQGQDFFLETEYGFMIRPDLHGNRGPMYLSKLIKL